MADAYKVLVSPHIFPCTKPCPFLSVLTPPPRRHVPRWKTLHRASKEGRPRPAVFSPGAPDQGGPPPHPCRAAFQIVRPHSFFSWSDHRVFLVLLYSFSILIVFLYVSPPPAIALLVDLTPRSAPTLHLSPSCRRRQCSWDHGSLPDVVTTSRFSGPPSQSKGFVRGSRSLNLSSVGFFLGLMEVQPVLPFPPGKTHRRLSRARSYFISLDDMSGESGRSS